MRKHLLMLGVVAVGVVLVYGSDDVSEPGNPPAVQTIIPGNDAGIPSKEVEIVELDDGSVIERFPASDFSIPTLDHGTISLSEYRGEKPVILVFWATWCPNCRRDLPVLAGLYEKYRDRAEIVAINLEESESTVRAFVGKNPLPFPVAFDTDGSVGSAYSINYTNSHVLVDVDGDVADFVLGDLSEERIVSFLGKNGSH